MSGLPWYKCDPAAFNNGMVGLTPAQRGAYATIINCIYIEGGPVRDDPLYFASILACDRKEWLAIRKALIGRQKLTLCIVDGIHCLSNTRAEAEITAFNHAKEKMRRGGVASVKARGMKPRNHLKLVED